MADIVTTNQDLTIKSDSAGFITSMRTFAFPMVTNLWPLLLFASQKVFVVPALIIVGLGDKSYRRDLAIAFLISLIGSVVYFTQFENAYSQIHLAGFALFVFSMPIINHSLRYDTVLLKRLLTYLTLFNALMGFYLLFSDVDLYGLRGLNRVEGTDGITYRVYFEASSLAAVFQIKSFRNRLVQIASLIAVAAFVVFVAKSIVIMGLLVLNLAAPFIIRSSAPFKISVGTVAIATFGLIYFYLPLIRPDIDLSLRAKQFQLDIIIGLMPDNWTGWGWGAFLPQLSTDREQPYQIEMQLPMLLLQIGPIALGGILALIFALFMSAKDTFIRGAARFLIYALIGFNNPWLFVPSWYLTCQLLFRDDEPERVLGPKPGRSL
jgi:hypothetical protein